MEHGNKNNAFESALYNIFFVLFFQNIMLQLSFNFDPSFVINYSAKLQ